MVTWIDNGEAWADPYVPRYLRTTTVLSTTVPTITKHYYAANQRIASRVDNDLYYTLNDPAGNAALFIRSDGTEAGHIIFDSSGEVVTNTLPSTLTEKLVSNLNLAANLQYNSQRWYDAGLSLHLQPSPFEGAPAGTNPIEMSGLPGGHAYIPRAFSRSSSTFVGGVFTALVDETTGYYAGEVSKSLANHFFYPSGTLSLEAARGTLARTGLLPFFQEVGAGTQGRYRFVSQNIAAEVEQNIYRTVEGEMIDLQGLVGNRYIYRRWFQGLTFTPSSRWTRMANFGVKNALPFGIDAGVQLWLDWDTDMPVDYRLGRAGISAGVGGVSGVLTGAAVTWAWGALGLAGGPPAWAVIGAGVIVGITVEAQVADSLNEWIFPVERQ